MFRGLTTPLFLGSFLRFSPQLNYNVITNPCLHPSVAGDVPNYEAVDLAPAQAEEILSLPDESTIAPQKVQDWLNSETLDDDEIAIPDEVLKYISPRKLPPGIALSKIRK